MIQRIIPKLPMRNKSETKNFYINQLGFVELENSDFEYYLMVEKDNFEIHFFEFKDLNPLENYGQIYIRTENIEELYKFIKSKNIKTTVLELKLWKQKEFSILDPNHNLVTFGQSVEIKKSTM